MEFCDLHALFDLAHTRACTYLDVYKEPWEAITGVTAFVAALLPVLPEDFFEYAEGVFVHRTAKIAPTACLVGPTVIGAGSEIRHGAFVRGGALVGDGCVVGNSVELKNCILFDGVQVPHLSYIGDSILGFRAHLGAGAMTSNLRSDRLPVKIRAGEETVETGLKKCGAFLGDGVEVGCNAVLCPGTVIGRNTTVYPLVMCRGVYPADSIVKHGEVVKKF